MRVEGNVISSDSACTQKNYQANNCSKKRIKRKMAEIEL